ncbi:MAG TPA: tRNA (adenosine(37)-N6)-dimethylallyltransferase MiaA [Alphaproteobacteria bacterium]|nr:tRNA (adenosine(37)-N6)-dimethylallyltransferase MiaA [Alphaproteobacteria bacterium]
MRLTGAVAVIYGPTASGKSDLAAALAERLNGVVINADSLQVYAELSILTARPGDDAMARAPHRLFGVLPAAQACSAARWRDVALQEIAAAHAAGRHPILVGGTGLYLKTLIEGLSPVPTADPEARAKASAVYEELGGEVFRAKLAERDPVIAARLKSGDRQRLIRAWEVAEATGIPLSEWQALPKEPGHALDFSLIGLIPPRDRLYARIDARFRAMLEHGALDEAARFEALGLPSTLPANKALGLPELRRYLKGEIDLAEATRLAQQMSRNYAKRQTTWFRHQMPRDKKSDGRHIRHAEFEELSERNLAEIMPIILPAG